MEVKSLCYDGNCAATVPITSGIHGTVEGMYLFIYPSYYRLNMSGQQAEEEH